MEELIESFVSDFLILQISSIRVLGWVAEPNLLGYLVLGGFPPKIIVTGLLLTEGLGSQDLLEKSPTAFPKDQLHPLIFCFLGSLFSFKSA